MLTAFSIGADDELYGFGGEDIEFVSLGTILD
jgi:hypothetical protein